MRLRILLPALLLAVLAASCRRSEPLPQLYQLPGDTRLVAMSGKPMTLGELRGNVVIYNFIFTRCRGLCPLLTARMKQVASKIDAAEKIRFASISVDPVNDTPEVLAQYAKQQGADSRWTFLTGERQTIIDLAVKGFKLATGEPTASADEPILHSTKFVLADAAGNIRGYYDSNESQELDRLVHDAERLAGEAK
jgi:protein SCO1